MDVKGLLAVQNRQLQDEIGHLRDAVRSALNRERELHDRVERAVSLQDRLAAAIGATDRHIRDAGCCNVNAPCEEFWRLFAQAMALAEEAA